MSKLKCTLISHSLRDHLRQIYTGYFLLKQSGLIEIEQIIPSKNVIAKLNSHGPFLRVIVNDSHSLLYDVRDACAIDEDLLDDVDCYFKRSYSRQCINSLGRRGEKIYPLGLNYEVHPNGFDRFYFHRYVRFGDKSPRQLYHAFFHNRGCLRVSKMSSFPDYKAPSKVLFMARTWDPDSGAPTEIEERIRINDTRAKCIKLLKDEFGKDFYGGFAHTADAVKQYGDLLLPEDRLSSKRQYLEMLRSYPICIATTGLKGSIGWKFAEYIAFSKAIVSEMLNYEVPGDLRKDQNYLQFDTPEECVENAITLFRDRELRNSIMENNAKYYHMFLKPDAMVLMSLLTALGTKQSATKDITFQASVDAA